MSGPEILISLTGARLVAHRMNHQWQAENEQRHNRETRDNFFDDHRVSPFVGLKLGLWFQLSVFRARLLPLIAVLGRRRHHLRVGPEIAGKLAIERLPAFAFVLANSVEV